MKETEAQGVQQLMDGHRAELGLSHISRTWPIKNLLIIKFNLKQSKRQVTLCFYPFIYTVIKYMQDTNI